MRSTAAPTIESPRCTNCGKKLAVRIPRGYVIDCPRCKHRNTG